MLSTHCPIMLKVFTLDLCGKCAILCAAVFSFNFFDFCLCLFGFVPVIHLESMPHNEFGSFFICGTDAFWS